VSILAIKQFTHNINGKKKNWKEHVVGISAQKVSNASQVVKDANVGMHQKWMQLF
jgi:formylmethanofuran dehydrogenase subunit B